ncbi:hypothetical protein R3P38DRAFT_3253861 [Favolaschia claudopus]|uniref:Uncharacterized protein n=1 Tax=Favolaschia claudopus TaxID=2862362 RepID=A0AAW0DXV8_9AGAR
MSNQDVLHAAALGALAFQSHRSNNPFFKLNAPAHPGLTGAPAHPGAAGIFPGMITKESQQPLSPCPFSPSFEPTPVQPTAAHNAIPLPSLQVPITQYIPQEQQCHHTSESELVSWQPSPHSHHHFPWFTAPPPHPHPTPWWAPQPQTHLAPPPVYQASPPQQLFSHPVPAIQFQSSASSYAVPAHSTTHNAAAAREAPQPRHTHAGTRLRQIRAMLEVFNTHYGSDTSTWAKTSSRITELATIIYANRPPDLDTFIVCCMLNALSASHPAFVDGLLNNSDLTSRFIEERLSLKADLMAIAALTRTPNPPRRRQERRRCAARRTASKNPSSHA